MKRFFLSLAAALSLIAAPAYASADKPVVIVNGQSRQLPAGDTLQVNASAAGGASINIPHGTAPSAPVNGDCWTTTAGLYCRINGSTTGPYTTVAGGGGLVAANNLSDVANAGTSRTNLGATTAGSNLFTLTNPSAITFLRVNADNTASALSASAFRTAIGTAIGSDVQAYDADLTTYAGITPSLNVQNLLGAADYAAIRSQLSLGTFATQNYATPPAIGGTTPAAGSFTTLSATGNLTTNVTGSTQCLQANSSGVVSGTGSACGAGGGGVTTTGSPANGNLTKFSGSATITSGDLSGDVTTSGTLATTLANSGVTAGSYTSANITVDAKGRVTAAANGSGGGGVPSGTSFPGSPSTGDRYYRTDRNISYFYNGTRWLSDDLFVMQMGDSRTTMPVSGASQVPASFANPWYSVYDIWVEQLKVGDYMNGTGGWNVYVTMGATTIGTVALSRTGAGDAYGEVHTGWLIASTVQGGVWFVDRTSGSSSIYASASFRYRLVG